MFRRGGGRGRNWRADNDHFEHDDRSHSNNTRRVNFKTGPNRGKKNFRMWKDPSKLLDDDIDMGAEGNMGARFNTKPFRGRGGRANSNVPKMPHGLPKRRFIPGPLPWYQITIPYGAKHEKDIVLRALLSHVSPEVFIPHYYNINGNAAIFYVDDMKIAEKLFNADRKIFMSDGFKLLVIVKNVMPKVNIDDNMREKMKLAMAKRYNAATKALDLTKFHADPDLIDIFCALFRPIVMLAAVDIMAENIPDLEALNLNDNKLHGLEHMKILSTKLKNLKILYMGDNRIPYLNSLDAVRNLPLMELYLEGNPLVKRFHDHETYISDVRKKFPKLTRLDGVELPAAIGFDVTEDAALPPRQQSYLADPQGQSLIREFLTQYFAIYDADSRQPLLDAYHEHAVMSMAVNYLSSDNRNSSSTRLNAYISNSRNVLRVTERESRRKYLRTGRLQVVSFLGDLPKTHHDLMGFSVDLSVFTPTLIVLTMGGVFRETVTQGNPTRYFHRTFVVVPNGGGGFCIMNDLLYITNTTQEQEQRAFSAALPPAAAGAAVAIPQPGPAPAALPAAPIPALPDEAQQSQLIGALGQTTGMNHHWSMNCLKETGWDLERAMFIFNHLQSEGKIPPDAFVK